MWETQTLFIFPEWAAHDTVFRGTLLPDNPSWIGDWLCWAVLRHCLRYAAESESSARWSIPTGCWCFDSSSSSSETEGSQTLAAATATYAKERENKQTREKEDRNQSRKLGTHHQHTKRRQATAATTTWRVSITNSSIANINMNVTLGVISYRTGMLFSHLDLSIYIS